MKRVIGIIFFFLTSVILITSCKERIKFTPTEGESKYVIDGYIADKPGSFTIGVYKTAPLDISQYYPVQNAVVIIIVNDTQEITLTGGAEGQYCTPDMMAAEGSSYKLKVNVDGHEFISTPQALPSSKPDEELKLNFRPFQQTVITSTGNKITNDGIMFSTEIFKSEDDTYYHWVLTEHYVIDAELIEEYQGNKYCYRTSYPNRTLFLLEDIQINEVSSYSHDLAYRKFDMAFHTDFSLEVERFILNIEAYQYYNLVKKQGQSSGGLFDPTSFSINGNMSSSIDDIGVLGFFGVHRKIMDRLFINKNELPYSIERNAGCFGPFSVRDGPAPYCYDCLDARGDFKSITNVKPDWWR